MSKVLSSSKELFRAAVAITGLCMSTYLLSIHMDGVAGAGFGMIIAWYFSK